MAVNITNEARKIYENLYPGHFADFSAGSFVWPVRGYTLREIRMRPVYSEIMPFDVDLTAQIGPVKMHLPIISAAMDAVSGARMLEALFEVGAVGIAYRDKKANKQLDILNEALKHKPGLVSSPKTLKPNDPLEEAKDILYEYDFSTIPVVGDGGVLEGILFTRDVAFKGHMGEPVKDWMMPFGKLKHVKDHTEFNDIKKRLLDEPKCNVLPVVDKDRRLKGIYFMIDFFMANPSSFNGHPLVGMAVGVSDKDLERVHAGLDMGVGIICVDSSHGNSKAVLAQSKKIVDIVKGRAAVIAGNVADIDGYVRLAETGVDAVKVGIGGGAICTTSSVTGAGFPIWTLIRECRYARKYLLEKHGKAPLIIPDGSIEGPGEFTIALAAGGHACMTGRWLVGAKESLSCQIEGVDDNGMVKYWGMASNRAIKKRQSDRYGKQKTAAEGVEGKVSYRGSLKKWLGKDIELIQGGFAHAGAGNIKELHEFSDHPMSFTVFTGAGQAQQLTPTVTNIK